MMLSRIELKTPWPRHPPFRWLSGAAVAGLVAWIFASNSAPTAPLTPLYALGPVVASIGLPAGALIAVALLCAVLAAGQAPDVSMLAWSLAAIGASTAVALRQAWVSKVLWESGRRWRALFNNVGVMLWVKDYSGVKAALDELRAQGVTDLSGYIAQHPDFPSRLAARVKIIDVNPATVTLFGAASKAEFMRHHNDVLTCDAGPFQRVLETIWEGGSSWTAEAHLKRLDGTTIPVSYAITFSPERPQLDRVVIGITDLSALHQAQENLSESRRALAHATRLTTMGELTASIGHELNQPLGAMVVQGQAALRFLRRPKPDLAEVRAGVEQMVEDGLRASEVLKRLRDFARRAPRPVEAVDLNALVEQTGRIIGRELAQYGTRLKVDLDPALPPVRGDRIELQQVLINLMVNAAQAMTQGDLTVSTAREEGAIVLSVADQGPGLGEGDPERLFHPFVTSKADGLGMGLAIVRSIVEAHGGWIRANDNPEGGATFVVRLPILED